MAAANNPQPENTGLRLSASDKKVLASIKQARTLYPYADVSADDSLCFLEDTFGGDAGERVVYGEPLVPRWLAQFEPENRTAAQTHACRLEKEFGQYVWNMLGWLARAVIITETWVGKYPPVPFKRGKYPPMIK